MQCANPSLVTPLKLDVPLWGMLLGTGQSDCACNRSFSGRVGRMICLCDNIFGGVKVSHHALQTMDSNAHPSQRSRHSNSGRPTTTHQNIFNNRLGPGVGLSLSLRRARRIISVIEQFSFFQFTDRAAIVPQTQQKMRIVRLKIS